MASLVIGNKKDSTIHHDSTPSKENTHLVLSSSTRGESSPSSSSSLTLSSSLRSCIYNYSTIAVVMAGLLATAAISSFTSSTSSSLDSSLLFSTSKDVPWPTDVFSSLGSASNPYKGTGELGSSTFLSTGRPTTTKEAASNGWKPLQQECVTELGYPWAFDGTITEGAPVTLYYSKETKNQDGVLTGMAVHYYDGVAPETMIGSIFSKGNEYDTIQVTFRDENSDVCRGRSLLSNQPYIALLLAHGSKEPKKSGFGFFTYRNPKAKRGRQLLPMTTDAAVASGEWVDGSCVNGMGTHWWHDIETGNDTLSYEAKNLFPITPMYDPEDGALVAIFFSAHKYMQASPVTLPPDNTVSNLWDVSHLFQKNGPTFPNLMCVNFCDPQCQFKGGLGEPPAFSSMHWWFRNPEKISTCTSNNFFSDECKPENFPVIG
mmetsp:Transcript_32916/g.36945  ORF Transcript_32916/g.36945 Transcript_32916/m.36945 type:complete len:431 (+) Transcript_32916:322-1614(+)